MSREPVSPFGRERARPGARRLLCGMRAHLRRQLLSRFLFRRRKPGGQPRGRLQGPMPQRRHGPLFVPVRRHDRGGRVADRRALCEFAQRRQIRENLRSELLLPAQGAELGGGARRRGSALWPREARHSGDAGEVGGNGAADHRSQGQARSRIRRASRSRRTRPWSPGQARRRSRAARTAALRSTRRPRRSSTPTAPTPSSAPRPPQSAARPPASPAATSQARRASA